MAWVNNKYHCKHCEKSWDMEWSCECHDDCPGCGVNYSPVESDDLTFEYETHPDGTVTLRRSRDSASTHPSYLKIGTFAAHQAAQDIADMLEGEDDAAAIKVAEVMRMANAKIDCDGKETPARINQRKGKKSLDNSGAGAK